MKKYLTLILILTIFGVSAQKLDYSSIPSGLRDTGPLTERDAAMFDQIEEVVLPEAYRYLTLPDSIDNSTLPWFRSIFSQTSYPNCMQSTSIAYNFTYEINRLRDLPASDSSNRYTTHFAWNFFNGGNGWYGVNYLYTMDVLKYHGTPSVEDYGGFYHGGGERWMSGYDEWYNAMNNRISGIRKIYVGDEEGLLTLKHWLNNHLDGSETGGVASFIACSPYGLHYLPAESPHAGKNVVTSWCPDPHHGMTIVGYNDSIRYDYNEDGMFTNDVDLNDDGIINMKDREIGALKFANSYGDGFANDGYCFMMYKTLADDLNHGGIWLNTVHILDAKAAHETLMSFKVSLQHNYRERIRVQAGISSDLASNKPEHIESYTIFNYQGGRHYMQGNDTAVEHKTIEFGLDVSPLLSYVEPGQEYKFFLIIDERDAENLGVGQVNYFSLMDYTSGLEEISSNQTNVPLVENGRTLVSVIHSPDFDKLYVTTEELPLYEAGQPIEMQMAANGGQTPYRWNIDKNHKVNITQADFPAFDDTQIMSNSLDDSIAIQQLEFSFPFYGNTFDSVMVSSSGYIALDENMYFWSYLSDMAYFLKHNRVVAPFLCQDMMVYEPYDNGIWYEGDESHASFRWNTTLSSLSGQSDLNFAMTLYPNGNIDFYYGELEYWGELRSVSGISDGDYVNYSLPELPLLADIPGNTKIEFIASELADEITISEDGFLSILDEAPSKIKDVKVMVTDNTHVRAFKTYQLTDGLEIQLLTQGNENNIIANGQLAGLKLLLKNRGSSAISNIDFNLSSDNPGMSIPDHQQHVEILQAGETKIIEGAFSCQSDIDIPDAHFVSLKLEAESPGKSYGRDFFVQIASPSLEMAGHEILNQTGILEPGKSANLQISLLNAGSRMSLNTSAVLSCNDPDISIGQPNLEFGTILAGYQALTEVYIIADGDMAHGKEVQFDLLLTDATGLSSNLQFSMRIGKVPVCIVDMDPANYSGPNIHSLLQQMDVECEYTISFPSSMKNYQSVILCLGLQFSYHEISYHQNVILLEYLNGGGNIYMESRVNWQQDPLWPIFDRFNIETEDNPGLYEILDGVDGTFTEGLGYQNLALQPFCYFSIQPIPPAYSIFTGREYPYCAAVAHDAGTYKTIGTIFELGALISSDSSELETYIEEVLEFFGVIQYSTGIEEVPAFVEDRSLKSFPNPFSHQTSIPLILDRKSYVEGTVYDLQGRKVSVLLPATHLPEGSYKFSWDGSSEAGEKMPGGIYIYRIMINDIPYTGKMILIR